MMSRSIARMRRRFQLQQPATVADPIGGFAQSWQTIAHVWGAMEPAATTHSFEAGQDRYRATHRIAIRWRPDVTVSMRLSGAGAAYLIRAVQDRDDRRAFMVCHCEEETP